MVSCGVEENSVNMHSWVVEPGGHGAVYIYLGVIIQVVVAFVLVGSSGGGRGNSSWDFVMLVNLKRNRIA